MAKANLAQTNFTAGELSPRMLGRVDVARYNNGLKRAENVFILVHGGAMRRHGLQFVAPAKRHDLACRLIPYVFNVEQAYQLEFGEQYVRVFDDAGVQILEPTKAITGATQANPVVITSNAHGYTNGQQVFITGVGGMTQLNGRWFTVAGAAANTFQLSGIDGTAYTAYTAGGTAARVFEVVSPYTSAQLLEVDFIQRADTMFLFHKDVPTQQLQRFTNTDWRMRAVPWVTEPFDELGTRPATGLTLSAASVGVGRTFTADAAAFLASDVGREIEAGGGVAVITVVTSPTVVTCSITSAFPATAFSSSAWLITSSPQTSCAPSAKDPVGATITLTLGAAGWRAEDVGKHVVINGGLCKITAFTSSTIVNAKIIAGLAATVAAEASSWALCRSMWGQEFGYPRTGSIHQQRLWCAGSPGFPQQTWMSRLGEYYDFEIGTLADAGGAPGVDSDQANPILHLASVRALVVNTSGSEFTISGGGDPITPTTIDIQNQSAYGSARPAPVRVGNELIFVCPSIDEETGNVRDELRAMSADRFDSSNYAAPDITALAEHVTESGIVDLDVQKSLLYAVRADGQLVTVRIDRDNDVVAASRQITNGLFESVSVIPKPNGSREVWVVVKRTIGGQDMRYIERFVAGLYMDSAVRGSVGGAGTATWGGLWHLEGETVAVRADDVVQAAAVVTAGQITLSRTANTVDIGQSFLPLLALMEPDFPTQKGSIQGRSKRTDQVLLRLKDTVGARVNGRDVSFRQFGENVLDVPIPPFSGVKPVDLLGFDRGDVDIIIEQPQAAPFHLLAVVRELSVPNG